MRVSYVKVLKGLSVVLGLLVYVMLAISMFSAASSLAGNAEQEEGSVRVQIDPVSGSSSFAFDVKNGGPLPSTLEMKVEVISGGQVTSEGAGSIELEPGSSGELSVDMELSAGEIAGLASGDSRMFFTFKSRTLGGLVGMGVRTEGGDML